MKKQLKAVAVLGLAAVALLASATLLGCKQKSKSVITVGATPEPHAAMLALIVDDLAKQGITLKVKEFTDYVTPNDAVESGEIDANFFQHVPYLESFAADRKLELEAVAKIHVEPLGLYSKKFAKVEELPAKATIAIPNDPTNEGRALILLQAKGLIKLAPDSGLKAGPAQIVENPKGFAFKELEAAELPRTLQDVDAAVINGNYALQSGLNPIKDALLLEGSDSPYVNVLVTRKGEGKDPRIQALIAALQSQKVKDYILQHYNGGVVAAF
jgi:D-methionine transport system substrate-binding protein